jgi:peptidoglycan/LPS O-acetylase OafA/YrhL
VAAGEPSVKRRFQFGKPSCSRRPATASGAAGFHDHRNGIHSADGLEPPVESTAAYRPDIDGLRAIAVLLVLVFHAFPGRLPGGFVGVDVFFAISGFLISGLILRDLREGTFSVGGFYVRRVRRIFPALALFLVVSLIAGYLLLTPTEFVDLGWHTAAGAAFTANLALWAPSGYFAEGARSKPLLHLWSLGVQEQFYFVWPLTLAALYRWTVRPWRGLAAITAMSFALCVWSRAPIRAPLSTAR